MKDFFKLYGKAIWVFLKKTPGFLWRIVLLYIAIFAIWYFILTVPFGVSMGFMIDWGLTLSVFVGLIFFWYLTIDSIVVAVRCLKLMKKFEISVEVIMEAVFKYDLLNPEYKNVRNGNKYAFDLWFDDAAFTYGFKKITIKYSRRR